MPLRDITDGLTDAEIRLLIANSEEKTADQFEKLRETLDILRDGATSQLLLHAQMTGNPELQLKGFIPDTQERLQALEERMDTFDIKQVVNHQQNVTKLEQIPAMQAEMKEAKDERNVIIRLLASFLSTKSGDGTPRWIHIVGAVGTAAGTFLLARWESVKHWWMLHWKP